MIKKMICVCLAAAFVLSFSACEKDTDGESTSAAEESTTAEYTGPSLDEMSPPSVDPEMPVSFPAKYSDTDTSGFEEISSEDALTDNFDTAHIYRDGEKEYYILTDSQVIVLIPAGNDEYYSAYYNENGELVYVGADNRAWFYNGGENPDYITYTYYLPYDKKILTFYEPDGSRFAVYANEEYYDDNLNFIVGEAEVALVQRVTAALAVLG